MDISHNSREFSLKHTWRGYIVITRYAVVDIVPGTFRWSRWHNVNKTSLGEVMKRLSTRSLYDG